MSCLVLFLDYVSESGLENFEYSAVQPGLQLKLPNQRYRALHLDLIQCVEKESDLLEKKEKKQSVSSWEEKAFVIDREGSVEMKVDHMTR